MPKPSRPPAFVAWQLLPGEVHALPGAQRTGFLRGRSSTPTCLRVLQGAVWVTWPGCVEDHFLTVGDELCLPDRRAGVLLEVAPGGSPGPARVEVGLGARADAVPRGLVWPMAWAREVP